MASLSELKDEYMKSLPLMDGETPRLAVLNFVPQYDFSKQDLSAGCNTCHNLSLDNLPPTGKVIQAQLCDVKRMALSGCAVCAMIEKACRHFDVVSSLVGYQVEMRSQQQDYGLEVTFGDDYDTRYVYIDDNIIRVFIHIQPADTARHIDYRVLVMLQGVRGETSHPIELYRLSRPTSLCKSSSSPLGMQSSSEVLWPAIGIPRDVPRSSNSSECLQTAQSWLADCRENHDGCKTSEPPQLPTRVLDISGQTVCLLESALPAEYVTLSYCWGPAVASRLTTTTKNIDKHKQGISWEAFNKTHQDAITVARNLGFRYIWIDALCIIQDSPQDWADEAARMADIYENSSLTICATWSSHSDGGLFSDRYIGRRDIANENADVLSSPYLVRDDPPIHARLVFKQHFANAEMKEAFELSARASVASDPLLTRAWCFQERMLSLRALDFTLEEIQWECRTARMCECKEGDRRTGKSQKMQFTRMMDLEVDSRSQFNRKSNDIWHNVVCAYTGLLLTYPSDRLPALSGLAHRIYDIKGDLANQSGYLAGIWQRDLVPSLLWHLDPSPGYHRGNAPGPVTSPQKYLAPSWSWASRSGQVAFTNFPVDPDLGIIDASCTYGIDICGHCTGGSLTLRGSIAPAKLRYGSGVKDGYWISQNGLWAVIQADSDIAAPGSVDHLPPGSLVYCLRVGLETDRSFSDDNTTWGLVLRYIEAAHQYARIGMFSRRGDERKLKRRERVKQDGIEVEEYIGFNSLFEVSEMKTIEIV